MKRYRDMAYKLAELGVENEKSLRVIKDLQRIITLVICKCAVLVLKGRRREVTPRYHIVDEAGNPLV